MAVPIAKAARQRPLELPPGPYCTPEAAAPGATTEVTFHDFGGGKPLGLWTSFPAETALVPDTDQAVVKYKLKVPADAQVGIVAVRLGTSTGACRLQLFMIDDLSSVQSSGQNDSLDRAQVLSLPLAVDGTCRPLTSDYYKITARQGQRVSIEVVARRLGSRMDPLVRLLDAGGRELAWCDDTPGLGADCRFSHTFSSDGQYVLEVRDAEYGGGPGYRYRLRLGDFPIATAAFPASGQHGTRVRLEFEPARGLPIDPLTLSLPRDARRARVGLRYPTGQGSGFVSVLCGDYSDFVADAPNHTPRTAARVTVPVAISGRFEQPGARDFYQFQVPGGERLLFRGMTRSIDSPANLVLRLLKSDGAAIAQSKPDAADEGLMEANIAQEGSYLLQVEDLNHGGGPGMVYRVEIQSARPGFELSTDTDAVTAAAGGSFHLTVHCTRHDYDGPIHLSLGGGGSDFETNHEVIPAGKTEADLQVKVPSRVPKQPLTFTIIGAAEVERSASVQTVSTAPALRKLFPRLPDPPPELDGNIGLIVRPPDEIQEEDEN